ncbi:MAG: ATP-dependent metallopeptidase FtsH/Yme1/Tma family protein, partial [Solobacterium sp.]|nr:ATP-dependent metallopeptidase FtsH/Yme1/Tma family protein [Solobacterium sp.]
MNPNDKNQQRKPIIYYYAIVMVILVMLNLFARPFLEQAQVQLEDYSTFMKEIETGKLEEVEIQSNQILYKKTGDETIYRTGLMNDPDLTKRLYDADVKFTADIRQEQAPLISLVVSWLFPVLMATLLLRAFMNRPGAGNSLFNLGKSNARVYEKNTGDIRFKDVAGEDEAKENLQEIVTCLHDPGKYKAIGAAMPKGILLVGPPGTGKTMLAKAVAGESNVPFISMSGSEFVEMFVGMGASKVRDLFKQAKEMAPCIVFIDEIDAIGGKRNTGKLGGNDEREQTLNQLLTEMDGFESNNGVVILAATNRPESLDAALLRPGRFDRRVPVELPDLQGREDILKVHAAKVKT